MLYSLSIDYLVKNIRLNKRNYIILILIIIVAFAIIRLAAFFKHDELVRKNSGGNSFRNSNHLILTKHAKCRMNCRHITLKEIKEILQKGSENYSKNRQGYKGDKTYALEGYSTERQHIRLIVAPDSDGVVIITCIDLDKDWPCNCN